MFANDFAVTRLAAIVDSSDDAIASKDLDGIIQTWNAAAERIFGYTAEEAVGKPMRIIIPEDRDMEEDMILARIRRGEKVDHFETVRRRKDGSLVNISVTVSPIFDRDGNVVGASKIARDITDRLKGEVAGIRLGAIIESSDDAIIAKDLKGVIQSWNRGAERLFGYLAEEIVGQPITVLLPPERIEEENKILARLRRGERVDHFETVRIRKDGSQINVSVTISPIKDIGGQVIGASKVARDISERKLFEATTNALTQELEQRVRERTADLEEAHKEMEAFTYSIAHDLRGPLRSIIATSSILFQDHSEELSEDAKALIERQAVSAKRLAMLIEALLKYSKIGKAQVSLEHVDLSKLAHAVIDDTKHDCEIAIQDGMTAMGDRNLLRLLLQNLIDNACKFSPERGKITVGSVGTTFFVRDQGMGFDMAYAEKIFTPFERLVRNDEIEGTGIGLANVKRIIEKHNGSIWANSAPGEGTTFYFTLGKSS